MSGSIDLGAAVEAARAAGETDPEGAILVRLQRGDLVANARIYDQDRREALGGTTHTYLGTDKRAAEPIPPKFWVAIDGQCVVDWANSSAASTWVEVDQNVLVRTTFMAKADGIYLAKEAAGRIWPGVAVESGAKVERGGILLGLATHAFRELYPEGDPGRSKLTDAALHANLLAQYKAGGGSRQWSLDVSKRATGRRK